MAVVWMFFFSSFEIGTISGIFSAGSPWVKVLRNVVISLTGWKAFGWVEEVGDVESVNGQF